MGAAQSRNTTAINQGILNNVSNVVAQTCSSDIIQTINDNVIIKTGGSGNISLINNATITGANCNMKTSIDTELTSQLSNTVSQLNSEVTGILPFSTGSDKDNYVDIVSTVQNIVANSVKQNCLFDETQHVDNNMIIAVDTTGDITIGNNSTQSNNTCIMDTITKTISTTTMANDVTQANKTVSIFVYIVIGIIVVVVGAVLIFLMYKLIGNKGGGGGSGIDVGQAIKLAELAGGATGKGAGVFQRYIMC